MGGDAQTAYDAVIGAEPVWTSPKVSLSRPSGWSGAGAGSSAAGNAAGVVGGVATLGTGLISAIDSPNQYGNPSTAASTGTGALAGAATGAAAGSVVPGIGTAVGAVVGGVVGGVTGWLKGKKMRKQEAEMFRKSNDARRRYDEAVSNAIVQDPGLIQGYKGASYFKNGGNMVSVSKYALGGPIGDEGKGVPKGYKPLTTQQRSDWNGFVRYLNRDVKVGGSKDLDDRTKDTGLSYLNAYKKANPNFSITADMVPYVQYEFQQLKNTNALPNVQPAGRVKTLVQSYFDKRDVSPVDGWIGSLTSRQGYPEVTEFSDDPQHKYWGLDYEGASKFEQEMWNQRKGKPNPNLERIPQYQNGGRLKRPALSTMNIDTVASANSKHPFVDQTLSGGYAKPLSSSATEFIGNSHAQGGIQIPDMGAEVEDGETTAGNFVFSKELGFAKLHRPIAKAIGKIEKKPQTRERVEALNRLKKREQDLATAQEEYKAQMGIS